MKRAAFVTAAVVLLASCARERTHIRAGSKSGERRVVVLGDSVAHGAGDETGRGIEGSIDQQLLLRGAQFFPAVNYGINGARTYDALRTLRTAPRIATATTVIVSIGGNDLYGDTLARLRATLWPAHAM